MTDEPDDDAEGRVRDKLVRAKEQWARDGRLLTGTSADPARDRLPPGQREVTDWPVLDLGVTPKIDFGKWRMRIDGLVERPLILDWQAFMDLPQVRMTTDIHCVTGWSRFDNAWEGVAARTILDAVRPKADAAHCIFYSRDGYTTNVRLDRFAGEDVLLARTWNGEPISAPHGGPLRVIMPRWYFWKSAKWLRRIEISAVDRPGYWEERGYHNDGDPWTEERYS
jgi:DMSO/TMAO reductase YedYZ molybdopterin-dependent catalytic subunit